MMAQATAQAATEALWGAMVELAEAGNDLVVQAQRACAAVDAEQMASIGSDLAVIASAAAVLARQSKASTS